MTRTASAHPARRTAALVLAACALGALASALLPANSAHATPVRRSTSSSSAPVWVPLHDGFGVDCAGRNPGCTSHRPFYSVDIVPTGQFGAQGRTSHALVYSMGAGVVHIGNPHGTACGSTPQGSFGTWVWIDHGHGVESRYGHLSKILVKDGTRVAAGTPIGVVGATGKAKNCSVTYLDFEIDHGKLTNANAYRFTTLQACTAAGPQTWPSQAASTTSPSNPTPVHFSVWGDVAHGTQFPASDGSCIPGVRTERPAG